MEYTKLDRVRPSPAGVWDSTRSYTALELVNSPDGWKAYLARKAVPAGTALTDTVYWTEVLDVSDVIAAAKAATADANAAAAFAEPIRTKADGIKCTLEGSFVAAGDASDDYLRGLRVFGKTTQNGTPSPESPVELVSVGSGGNIGVGVRGKNLLGGFQSQTLNGVTFTVNGDGSVTVAGTSKWQTDIRVTTHLVPGTYMLSGCPDGGSSSSADGNYAMYTWINNIYKFDTGSGVVLAIDEEGDYTVCIVVRANTTINKTFYPMLEQGSTKTSYEPYKGQSLALSTPNGLPGIPVSSGGNYTDADGQMWFCDEIDLERGVYVQRVATQTIKDVSMTNNTGYWTDAISQFAGVFRSGNADKTKPCILTHGETGTWFDNTVFYGGAGSAQLFIVGGDRQKFGDTVESCNAYLTSLNTVNPVTMLYALATPIETALSAAEIAAYRALHSNYPNTTVYNDAGAHMAVSYNADTKTYIDNKFAALSAAIV